MDANTKQQREWRRIRDRAAELYRLSGRSEYREIREQAERNLRELREARSRAKAAGDVR